MFIKFAVFNMNEHLILNEQMSINDILNKAITAFDDKMPRVKAKKLVVEDAAFLEIMGVPFRCVVEQALTVGQLCKSTDKKRGKNSGEVPMLYVTVNLTPKTIAYAEASGINVLDCAGNCVLQSPENSSSVFFFANKGEKPLADFEDDSYPIFREAGLKVIFYFLLERNNINKTYREIQSATGVAIGTVKNVIAGMVYRQFARVEGRKRFLTNIERLLTHWIIGYGQNLRPKLFVTRMKFRDKARQETWKDIALPEGVLWGSEPAEALSGQYLTPGDFVVYTDEPISALLKTGTMMPQVDGNIAVYQKFWKTDYAGKTVPPVLIYADLMDAGNGRCVEAAKRMTENELKYLF